MSSTINWNDTIKKEARGVNHEDLGEVQDVSNGYVFVQKGLIIREKFFIPQGKVESFDGDVLTFSISKEEASDRFQGDNFPASSQNDDTKYSNLSASSDMTLIEERLNVNKTVEQDQATITKELITETKTLEVPVTHEEISIQRRHPSGNTATSQNPITSKEKIEIPLKREKVEVSKIPYVREEVVVSKKPVTETKEVTEQITSEYITSSNT